MGASAVVNELQGRKAIIVKVGMDAHWRGAIVVANALREAGMEVVYLGHASPEEIVAAVEQEDPVLVGISALSGNHMTEVPAVVNALRAAAITDVAVVVGGAIGERDIPALTSAGVAGVFPTGSQLDPMLEAIGTIVAGVRPRGSRR